MNFLGLGPFEILVVLIVAFIFLGPERMVDAARFLGRVVREVRRLSAQLPEIDLESEELIRERPIVHRGGGPRPADGRPSQATGDGASGVTVATGDAEAAGMDQGAGASAADEGEGAEEGPVPFTPAGQDPEAEGREASRERGGR